MPYTEIVGTSFHIENFGCRAARADGEAIASRLLAAGHCAQRASNADIVLVNTCSVTAEADREARAFIRRTHRLNPQARIIATGCYAQRAPEELAGLAGIAAVVGNSHKALVPQIALGLVDKSVSSATLISTASLIAGGEPLILADDTFAHSFLEEAQVVPGTQTRPNLKIQEGCGNRCSFCVIPQTRGSSRSLSADAILRQVEGFVAAGGKELVLSGINLGRWGRDTAANHARVDGEPTCLARLVRRIFAASDLPRLRLSSIEPMDWDADLIAVMAEFGGIRLARHVHLPLQSGSDAVLRRMHRRYRPWHYADKVEALVRATGATLTLGADIMVGFPGETDAEFEETLALVRSLPFGYLHIFPFSPRPATRAWTLHQQNPVAAGAVDERLHSLRALAAEKSLAHRRRFLGSELDAITLHTPADLEAAGKTTALTENFLPAEISDNLPPNTLVRLRIDGLSGALTLLAQVVDPAAATSAPSFVPTRFAAD